MTQLKWLNLLLVLWVIMHGPSARNAYAVPEGLLIALPKTKPAPPKPEPFQHPIVALPAQTNDPTEIIITLGGDMNFTAAGLPPHPRFTVKGGQRYAYSSLFKNLARHVDGDLNFANIETVVTAKQRLKAIDKRYVFRSHPNALNAAIDVGFNLFSLANNHAYDHGWSGYKETLISFDHARKKAALAYAGLGTVKRASAPKRLTVKGQTFALNALTFLSNGHRATKTLPGTLNYRRPADFDRVLDELKDAKADLRMISLHGGTENQVKLDTHQKANFRKAVEKGGARLVIGHHPHVARPIAHDKVNDAILLYGLGNYLMIGAGNRDNKALGFDFGLMVRLYMKATRAGALRFTALEAIPLKGVHRAPYLPKPSVAAKRIAFLNRLGRTELGQLALNLEITKGGTGFACFGAPYGERAKKLCSGGSLPKLPPPKLPPKPRQKPQEWPPKELPIHEQIARDLPNFAGP